MIRPLVDMTSVQDLNIVIKCCVAPAGYRNNKCGMVEVRVKQSLLTSSWQCSFPTKQLNSMVERDVEQSVCYFSLSTSQDLTGKEHEILQKSHLVHGQNVSYCSWTRHILNQEKSPGASLNYFRLDMHKSTRTSVFSDWRSRLLCAGYWKPHSAVTALLNHDKSASMSSWTCPWSVQKEPSILFIGPSLAGGPALNVLHNMVDRNEYYFKGYFQIASMRKNLLGAGQTNSAQELCYKTQIRVSQNADFLKRESQLVPQYLSKFVCHFKHAALYQGLVFNERTVTKFLGNVSGMHSQKCQDIILLLGNVFLFEGGKSICFSQTNYTILHF